MTPTEINALNVTIPKLHQLYERLTGYRVQLTWAYRHRWEQWITYRPHEPFTERDLESVIRFIQDQIAQGRRRQQSLHILNLIEDCERFELDLQDARGRAKRFKPSSRDGVLRATGRPLEDRGHSAEPVSAILQRQELAKKLSEWSKGNL